MCERRGYDKYRDNSGVGKSDHAINKQTDSVWLRRTPSSSRQYSPYNAQNNVFDVKGGDGHALGLMVDDESVSQTPVAVHLPRGCQTRNIDEKILCMSHQARLWLHGCTACRRILCRSLQTLLVASVSAASYIKAVRDRP